MKILPIRFGLLLAAVRLAIHLVLLLLEKTLGEASMLLLADIPTFLVCWGYSAATGRVVDMGNVYDERILSVAIITWFVLGCLIGLVLAGGKKRRSVPRVSI